MKNKSRITLFFIILLLLFVLGCFLFVKYVFKDVTKEISKEETQEIKIVGRQFEWYIWYPSLDGVFGSNSIKNVTPTNIIARDLEGPYSKDDVVINQEAFHLIKAKKYRFLITSRDVLHSAYFPHFRSQINAIPEMESVLEITPDKTTEEIRAILDTSTSEGASTFDYFLMCNKICGSGHSLMHTKIIVESEIEFNRWLLNNAKNSCD